jgi:alpha-glucosidase
VRRRLPYLKGLGVGALWLSPFLKNCRFSPDSYHGYGIHDFLSAEPLRHRSDDADEGSGARRRRPTPIPLIQTSS